jgi:hypothetical protein
MCFHEYFYD